MLRHLGVDDVTLRAARVITGKAQLEAFGSLMPEDQFEALWLLAEGFEPEDIYRDLVAARQAVAVEETERKQGELAAAVSRTRSRIALVTGPEELADILAKPFDAWRIFLHPTQRRVAYRPAYTGPAQITGGPGTGKTVVALHRVKHLLGRSPDTRVLLTTYTGALARSLRSGLALLLDHDQTRLDRVTVTTVDATAHRIVRELHGNPGTSSATRTSGDAGSAWPAGSNCRGPTPSWPRSTGMCCSPRTCAPARSTRSVCGADAAASSRPGSVRGCGRRWRGSRRNSLTTAPARGCSCAPEPPGCWRTDRARAFRTTTWWWTRRRTCTRPVAAAACAGARRARRPVPHRRPAPADLRLRVSLRSSASPSRDEARGCVSTTVPRKRSCAGRGRFSTGSRWRT
ncbi:UvrD-helicase domain-containing protein [Streptomyces sp. M19]